MVVPALLIAGATMAFLYLLVPVFFAFFVGIYILKFSVEIWAWRKVPREERHAFRAPCRLLNFNFTLSVKLEWAVFLVGFFGLIIWIEYAQRMQG